MKKLFVIATAALLFSACGSGSKKGAWSDSDKNTMKEEMSKAESALSSLGDKKQAYLDCVTKKLEDNYDDYASATKDKDGVTKYATECAMDVMKSK